MVVDIAIKDFYLLFIKDAVEKERKYIEINKHNKELKEETAKYLIDNKKQIKEDIKIDIDNYKKEFVDKIYNDETLYNKVIKISKNITNEKYKVHIIQLLKYCTILRNENKINKNIKLYNKYKNIKFSVYRTYVSNFYNKVHEYVLEGNGYRYGYGIGTYCINYWRLNKNKLFKNHRIDFAATNANKKKLLEEGKKPYNDKEAAWYKARNIPYDGVDYRVFKTDSFFYDFTFIKSNIFKSSNLDYERTEYLNKKYRGMSYKEIADKYCKTFKDIVNLQVDLKYKLNILLYKDPTKYLNFIRNAEQCKYKCGAHNS